MSKIKEDGAKAGEENAENFELSEFFGLGWDTIDSKTEAFAPYFRQLIENGSVMREAASAASHRQRFVTRDGKSTSELLMFGSNNYLGLADEPEIIEKTIAAIRQYGIGCGGPPLFNGTTTLHRQLETKLAQIKGCEDAMLYSSGYAANVGWTTGLLGEQDVLLYDAQNHASLYDGIKMGNFQAIAFRHNDLDHLRKRLMQVRYRQPYTNVIVVVEGVYSMDGDIAPLREIRALSRKYDALLAIDDAHGMGVLGKHGYGTAEHFELEGEIDIVMGTFSKMSAVTGGFVCGAKKIIDYLRIFSRSYMFSASLPPSVVAGVLAGIEFIEEHPERVKALRDNVDYLVAGLRAVGFSVQVETAIVPIFVPQPANIAQVMLDLQDEGLFVNAVTYPAVPQDRQRLRLSVMATFSKDDLDFAIDKLRKVGLKHGFLREEVTR